MLAPAVILGYHGIAEVDPKLDPIRLFVAPDDLGWQIATLKRRGYEFLTVAELVRRMRELGAPPERTCALTFDDGTADQATILPRVLAEHQVPGTIYVCPELLGEAYPWADEAAGARFMTREELDEIARDPLIEIGSHTNRHTELHEADEETAYAVMKECKDLLEDWLDREIPSFCYPRCHYSAAAPRAAERCGYESAVTCGPRGSWDPYELNRENLHTPDGRVTFAFKSRGLYFGLRDAAPFRFARWATRPIRHRRER